PFLSEQTSQDLGTLSWVFTALSGGVVLMQAGFGKASEQLGLSKVLSIGMTLMGFGMLGITFAPNLPILLIIAALAGVGFGGVVTSGNIIVARVFASRSASALNAANVFFGVGSILGPTMVGLIGEQLGLPQAALWLGSAMVLTLAALVPGMVGSLDLINNDRTTKPTARTHTRTGAIWLLGLVLMIYTGTEIGFSGWVMIFVTKSTGVGMSQGALVASTFWLALTSGRILGAALGMRITTRMLLLTALAGVLAGASLLLVSVGDYGRSLVGALLLGLACGPIFPPVIAVITTVSQGDSATAGKAMGLGNSGGLVLPALFGLLLTSYSPLAMITMVLICAVAMLSLGGLAMTPPRQASQ
ncbi:MAG: MFS transporter, partial [Oscillochloris sp.]|nr:MFS transporter [Oscillochloris sp.]